MSVTRLSWMAGILLGICICAAKPVSAAPAASGSFGIIQGKVLSAETKQPLGFATVTFRKIGRNPASEGEPVGGAVAGRDGTFSGKLASGRYNVVFSYPSYQDLVVRGIRVATGDTVRVDGSLEVTEDTAVKMEPVLVEGTAVKTSEASMLTKQKNSSVTMEAITSEQISKSTDSNAAEALQRVTSVTVVGGRNVFVRGLGERYSQTKLNGTSIASPEPNKKVVPLDIFPTEVLDNMTVQKTYTPDMDGEFAGGVIDLNTKEYAKNLFRHSLSIGRTETATGEGSISYQGGGLDFLGFDDGTRSLPDIVEDMAGDKPVTRDNFDAAQTAEMGKAFENIWTPKTIDRQPNFSYAGLFSQQLRTFGKESGVLATFSINNSSRSLEKEENSYTGSNPPIPVYRYHVQETENTVLWGLNLGSTTRLSEDDKVKLNLLYTRHSDDQSRITGGMNEDRGSVVQFNQLNYVQRGLFSGILQGDHGIGFLNSTLTWDGSYSRASRSEPDRRETIYEQNPGDSLYYVSGAFASHPLNRVFGESVDKDWAMKLDWTVPFKFDSRPSSVKAGLATNTKDRFSEYRRFGFTSRRAPAGSEIDYSQPPEMQTTPDNIDEGLWTLEETTRPNDTYTADQKVRAAFLMVDTPLLPNLRVVAGGRYEYSEQAVDAQSLYAVDDPGVRVHSSYRDFLPAVNLTFTPTDKLNLRAAYAKTLNRPELREVSPFTLVDYETNREFTGNPELIEARIENYDLRGEIYPSPGELLALGAFYKELQNPIVRYVIATTGALAETPVNGVEKDGRHGHLVGWESEARLSLHHLWTGLDWAADLGRAPGFLDDWSVAANYSRVESEVYVDKTTFIGTIPLAGQSEYSSNFGLFYSHRPWDSAILYRAFGPRLSSYSLGALEDIYEYPPESLDFTLTYRLNGSTRFKFSAENLLSDRLEFRQGDYITQAYETGTTFGVSVSYQADTGGN